MARTEQPIRTPTSKPAKVTPAVTLSREPGAGVYYAIQHLIEMMRTFWTFHKQKPPRS